MNVPTIARLIEKWLGCKRCEKVILVRDITNRLAGEDMVIGSGQRIGMMDGEFLLTVTEFSIELFRLDALLLERDDEIVDHFLADHKASGAKAYAFINRAECFRTGRFSIFF